MNFECKLVKKTFTTKDNETREYYVLQFNILQDEILEITIKNDKAKLLILSQNHLTFPDFPLK